MNRNAKHAPLPPEEVEEVLEAEFQPPDDVSRPGPSPRRRAARGGLIAGLVAGAALSAYMMGMNLLKGQDIWIGAKMAGYPFLRETALQPGFDLGPVAIGVVCHFAVSLIWGVLFGWLAYGRSASVTLALGAIWGVIVWIGMYDLVLPVSGAGHLTEMMPVGRAVLEHIGFGLALAAAFLLFQRSSPPEEP